MKKYKKLKKLIKTGEYDADVAKYIRGMLELVYQGMLEDIYIKEQSAHISYKDMENLEFQIISNPNSIHICFPMKI